MLTAIKADDLLVDIRSTWLKSSPASDAEQREQLIHEEHELGHFGREAIYKQFIHDNIWWPNMRNDIKRELA